MQLPMKSEVIHIKAFQAYPELTLILIILFGFAKSTGTCFSFFEIMFHSFILYILFFAE